MDADLVLEGGGVKGIGSGGCVLGAHRRRLHVPPDRGDVRRRHRRGVDRGRHGTRGPEGHHADGRLRAVPGRGLHRPPGVGGQGVLGPVREGDLRGALPGRVAGPDPLGPRHAHVRRSAHRRPRLVAAAGEAVQARRHDLGRHAGRAGAAAVGLPALRPGGRRPVGGRSRARLDVDPVLLRAAPVHRPRRRRQAGAVVHGRRRHALELPDRGVRPHRREAASVAHVRDQALRAARRSRAGAVRREGSVRSGACDGRHDDELPRPDAHRRSGRPRANDVRRHGSA